MGEAEAFHAVQGGEGFVAEGAEEGCDLVAEWIDDMVGEKEFLQGGENRRFWFLWRETASAWKVLGTPAKRPAGEQKRRRIARTQKTSARDSGQEQMARD